MYLKKIIAAVAAAAMSVSAFSIVASAYTSAPITDYTMYNCAETTVGSETIYSCNNVSKTGSWYISNQNNYVSDGKVVVELDANLKGSSTSTSFVSVGKGTDSRIVDIQRNNWSGAYTVNGTDIISGQPGQDDFHHFIIEINYDTGKYSVTATTTVTGATVAAAPITGTFDTTKTFQCVMFWCAKNQVARIKNVTVTKYVPDHATVSDVTGGDWYHYVEADGSVAKGKPDATNPVGVKINSFTIEPGDYAVTGATVTYTSGTLVPKESGATVVDNGKNKSYSYDVSFGTAITAGPATIAILVSTSNGADNTDSMGSSNFSATAIEGSIIE